MIGAAIKSLIALLLIFTPLAFGSMDYWAFSLMELGILSIIILGTIEALVRKTRENPGLHGIRQQASAVPTLFLGLFLGFILLQMLPLPLGLLKIVSPKTYALRLQLSASSFQPSPSSFPVSFVPFVTQVEFLKWFALSAFFLFLVRWRLSGKEIMNFIPVVMFVGIVESLYGMVEFFSGHRHILYVDAASFVSSVTGTFINRNYLAGYLLMVIPLVTGYLFYREAFQKRPFTGWRHRLPSLDGKTYFIAFSVILMIVALLFTASRMGVLSLLLSFSLIAFFFRDPRKGGGVSKTAVLIFSLSLLWALWIGLDAVISRFFRVSDDFEVRRAIWFNTFQILKDFPVLGTGLGTFVHIFPSYRSFHIVGLVSHAENDFLQLASEVGLVGTGLLLTVFLFFLYRAFFRVRTFSYEDPERYIGIGGLVGMMALILHSFVERNIQIPANAFLFTFLLAMVLRIGLAKRAEGTLFNGQ
jgi:O-antigen ligase